MFLNVYHQSCDTTINYGIFFIFNYNNNNTLLKLKNI